MLYDNCAFIQDPLYVFLIRQIKHGVQNNCVCHVWSYKDSTEKLMNCSKQNLLPVKKRFAAVNGHRLD